ncbi:hypothetical protein BU25DRAFT_156596 [Macroventuria anomochaeta]|uniref:Uncharacterized protein n=1 Tax=Macroventuria anomochaeta TaxID=301207 RepID=A0ACB6RU09_9PLEO|nr:uncharacterized protein BU25DRAFT_156596 [Macroventuria anomochaeta]KAF2624629.1 hypothetical protein BU25DRAFT_156596 [Macroventuria anomochaeta]
MENGLVKNTEHVVSIAMEDNPTSSPTPPQISMCTTISTAHSIPTPPTPTHKLSLTIHPPPDHAPHNPAQYHHHPPHLPSLRESHRGEVLIFRTAVHLNAIPGMPI